MNHKQDIEILIKKLLSQDLSQQELEQLERYINEFPEYKDLMTTHRKLMESEYPAVEPDTVQYNHMRAEVLRKIRIDQDKSRGYFPEFLDKVRIFFLRPEMAVAALTLIIGFLFGRALPPDQGNLTSNLIDRISSLATKNSNLEDVRRSPVIYSNVQYRDINDDMVSINLDATTHLDFIRKKNDPLVRDIMAQTLLGTSNIGSEFKTFSYTKEIIDPTLKEALIFSMLNTPTLAIRMKAMSGLMEYKFDDEIKEAFLKVLQEEESVNMRLAAVDYLTNLQVNPSDMQEAIDKSDVSTNPAVMIKMKKYMEDNDSQ